MAVYLRICFSLGLLLILAACGEEKRQESPKARPPVPILAAAATTRTVPVQLEAIGNVEAYSTISVKAQVTGQLVKAFFQEGDFVKKGSPLFNIDSRPLEAALNQATANAARDEAALQFLDLTGLQPDTPKLPAPGR